MSLAVYETNIKVGKGRLKELYTSETTLAQKIVLTPLNNEFRFKNLYSTQICRSSKLNFKFWKKKLIC